jgi:hypothetical protein
MSITVTRTRPAAFGAALCARIADAFAWAERSPHHRLGSAFVLPETLANLHRAVEDATGRPVGQTGTA